jgi:hypothetical protein
LVERRIATMDLNRNAFRIVDSLTSEKTEVSKNVMASKAGGLIGGPARAARLSPAQRKAIAVKASAVRWGKAVDKGEKGGRGDA